MTRSLHIVILNLFQDNAPPSPVILERSHREVKQVQDEGGMLMAV